MTDHTHQCACCGTHPVLSSGGGLLYFANQRNGCPGDGSNSRNEPVNRFEIPQLREKFESSDLAANEERDGD